LAIHDVHLELSIVLFEQISQLNRLFDTPLEVLEKEAEKEDDNRHDLVLLLTAACNAQEIALQFPVIKIPKKQQKMAAVKFNFPIKKPILLSMPLVNGLNVAKDHPVFAVSEVLGHWDLVFSVCNCSCLCGRGCRGLCRLGVSHEFDVLTTVLQVADVYSLRVEKLL